MSNYTKNVLERMIRGGGIAYFVAWQQAGTDYDHLFTWSNLQGAIVGAALSLALSLGFMHAGNQESGGIY